MTKLLRAGFSRLFQQKIFWILSAGTIAIGLFEIITQYFDSLKFGMETHFDSAFFSYLPIIAGCAAIFCSLFIGTEYSDGTIRNKLVVGHRRANLYVSGYLVSLCAALLMSAFWIILYVTLGLALLGKPVLPFSTLLLQNGIAFLTLAAFNGIYTLISMSFSKKSNMAVLCLLLFLGLIIGASLIQSQLEAPEFVNDYTLTQSGVEVSEMLPNPRYLSGIKREIYQWIQDFLPGGQALQFALSNPAHPGKMALYSFVIIIITNLVGIAGFHKKDIK